MSVCNFGVIVSDYVMFSISMIVYMLIDLLSFGYVCVRNRFVSRNVRCVSMLSMIVCIWIVDRYSSML